MLKHNFLRLAATVIAAAGLFFTSCKSAPKENPVDPVELLDDNGGIYLQVPVQPNKDFVTAAIKKIAKCSENDAQKISERLENLYICVAANGTAQLAASGTFPSKLIGMVLSEKNGWNKNTYLDYVYYKNRSSNYQLSIPSNSVACVSQNSEVMLSRYEEIAKNDIHNVTMNEKVYNFLHGNNTSDIMVYSPLPKVFIRTFIGANVNAPVESIDGQFKSLKDGKQFGLKIVLEMEDPRTVKAACAALKIALFPIPAKIVQTGTKQITVTDITLDYNDLLKFIR